MFDPVLPDLNSSYPGRIVARPQRKSRGVLRVRRARPGGCSAAENLDEFAARHVLPFRVRITPHHDSASLNWKLCLCTTAKSIRDDGNGSKTAYLSIGRMSAS